jgi:hypothetical protein
MAVKIERLGASRTPGGLVADRRLYETAEGRPAEEGDPAAAFLVACGPGDVIEPRVATRLGLVVEEGRLTWPGEKGRPAPAPPVEEPAAESAEAPAPAPEENASADVPAETTAPEPETAPPSETQPPPGLPDGYQLEAVSRGGWYGVRLPDGQMLSGPDGVMKVRGKDNALKEFAARLADD